MQQVSVLLTSQFSPPPPPRKLVFSTGFIGP